MLPAPLRLAVFPLFRLHALPFGFDRFDDETPLTAVLLTDAVVLDPRENRRLKPRAMLLTWLCSDPFLVSVETVLCRPKAIASLFWCLRRALGSPPRTLASPGVSTARVEAVRRRLAFTEDGLALGNWSPLSSS